MNERPEDDRQDRLLWPQFFDEPAEEEAFDFWRYWRIVRNRLWLIVGATLAVFTIAAIKVYRTPPVYEAMGTIAIQPARQQVLPGFQGFTPAEQTYYEGIVIQMQLDLLNTRSLAWKAIQKLAEKYPQFAVSSVTTEEGRKRKQQLIGRFRSRLKIEKPEDRLFGKRVITLRYRSTDPQFAADALNTLMETFVEQNKQTNVEAVEEAAEWLTKELAKLENKLEKSKKKLLEYQQNAELLSLGEATSNPALERFSTLNAQLAQAEADRLNAEILYRLARQGGLDALPEDVHDPVLDRLRQERAGLEAKLSELLGIYQDNAPPVEQIKAQMAAVDRRIEEAKRALIEKLEKQYRVADERVQALTEAVEKQRAEILKQNRGELEFSLLKRESEVDEKYFEMLAERLRQAQFMRTLTPRSNIRIVDRAEVPLHPAGSDSLTLLLAVLIGLAIGVGVAFLLEFIDDRIKTVEEVETLLKLPNLGVIPLANGDEGLLRGRKRSTAPLILGSPENGDVTFAEAYRTLRTSVLLSSANRPPRTIVITSFEAEVGKSTTAANMAIALAQAGKHVLLIEADMRHSGLTRMFNTPEKAGLSTYLSSEEESPTLCRDCGVKGLDFLSSGPIPPNPSELLSSERLPALIESMAEQYDHVIIDTPPVGIVADGLILAALADGVILVVRAEETSRRGIKRVKEALRQVNARILGVVVNAVDMRRHGDGYYGYGYGYGYGYYHQRQETSKPPDEPGS